MAHRGEQAQDPAHPTEGGARQVRHTFVTRFLAPSVLIVRAPARLPAMDSATSFQPGPGESALADPHSFINRELSNIAFLERVLEEASDPRVGLSERLRFLAILSATLDEFFMIRVAGLKQQISGRVEETGPDAMTPAEQLGVVSQRCHALIERQDRVLLEELLPALEKAGMRLFHGGNWPAPAQAAAAEFFEREVLPVLTPLAIDPGHPFPHLRNKSLNLAISFATPAGARLRYGVVPVPSLLPRVVPVPGGAVMLEDVIARHVARLFPAMPVQGCWAFRVTRNWDLTIDGEEAQDLLAIKMVLYRAGEGSPIVRALQRAAENGKQVTALVELKARMDEEANILWARELEQAGVHVVYGLIGFKTHSKLALVVRAEAGSIRRYVHLGTGNYNSATARSYSDLSLFTAREDVAADATALCNLPTGYSKPAKWRKFLVSPLGLKQAV